MRSGVTTVAALTMAAALALSSQSAQVQSPVKIGTAPVGHIGVAVQDVDAAAKAYAEVLDLPVPTINEKVALAQPDGSEAAVARSATFGLPNFLIELQQSKTAFGPIHDTSLAAMLLGFTHTGLSALCQSFLGFSLAKELQRHDWSRRPILPEHVDYLVNDTRHLFALTDLMLARVREHDLLDEYEIECRVVAASEPVERDLPHRQRRTGAISGKPGRLIERFDGTQSRR